MIASAMNPAGMSSFHDMAMSWSTRNRGSVQRTHIKMSTNTRALPSSHKSPGRASGSGLPRGDCQPPRNSTVKMIETR